MPGSHTGLEKPSLLCASDLFMIPKTGFSNIFGHVVTISFDIRILLIFANVV